MGYWGFAVISLMHALVHTRLHACVQAHMHIHALAHSYKAHTLALCMHIAHTCNTSACVCTHVHTYLHMPTGTCNLCMHIHIQAHTHKSHNAVCTCSKCMHIHTCTHTYTCAHIHRVLRAHRHDCTSQALLSSLGRRRSLIHRHRRGGCFGQVQGTLIQGAVTGPPWSHRP